MLKYFVLAFILFASLATAKDYDYLQLVLQWPSVTCQMKPRCVFPAAPKTGFTLHGMWPGNFSARVQCNRPTQATNFDWNLLKGDRPLLKDMDTAWPNVLRRSLRQSNKGFWAREYNKHGTCAKFASQDQYLRRAVDLRNANNVLDMFAKHQITSQRRLYNRSLLVSAIENEISDPQVGKHFSPMFRCFKSNNQDWLWEVAFCYDPTGANRIDCSLVQVGGQPCGQNIYF